MPLESDSSACACSSVILEGTNSAGAYGKHANENFEAEKAVLATSREDTSSLAEVKWALQTSLKEAERLQRDLVDMPKEKFEEAAQAASDGLLWQREQTQCVKKRVELVMQAKLALKNMQQMLTTQHAAPDRLAKAEEETMERCNDTVVVHQKLAQAAEQVRSSFKQDVEKKAMQLSDQLREEFQPLLADCHALLVGIIKFLRISSDQVQRESANGVRLYTEKLAVVKDELAESMRQESLEKIATMSTTRNFWQSRSASKTS
mmetsp:Transcript_22384/g.40324  ORF Transcript_22384/g.40324 Transcript_22384/m.40324 type:complete len:262 (+) Transcript_22384:228-1013(+)